MKYSYKNKEYEVIKVGKQWRVYSTDPTTTKEEATEVLKSLEKEEQTQPDSETTEDYIIHLMDVYGLDRKDAEMAAEMHI